MIVLRLTFAPVARADVKASTLTPAPELIIGSPLASLYVTSLGEKIGKLVPYWKILNCVAVPYVAATESA